MKSFIQKYGIKLIYLSLLGLIFCIGFLAYQILKPIVLTPITSGPPSSELPTTK